MISGSDIRAARERAGLTQQALAQAVAVSQRTVGNWERGETVPLNREARIRSVLDQHLRGPGGGGPTLAQASDAELLAEIARRFARTSPDAPRQ